MLIPLTQAQPINVTQQGVEWAILHVPYTGAIGVGGGGGVTLTTGNSTPGGLNNSMQYNDEGNFAGSTQYYNKTTQTHSYNNKTQTQAAVHIQSPNVNTHTLVLKGIPGQNYITGDYFRIEDENGDLVWQQQKDGNVRMKQGDRFYLGSQYLYQTGSERLRWSGNIFNVAGKDIFLYPGSSPVSGGAPDALVFDDGATNDAGFFRTSGELENKKLFIAGRPIPAAFNSEFGTWNIQNDSLENGTKYTAFVMESDQTNLVPMNIKLKPNTGAIVKLDGNTKINGYLVVGDENNHTFNDTFGNGDINANNIFVDVLYYKSPEFVCSRDGLYCTVSIPEHAITLYITFDNMWNIQSVEYKETKYTSQEFNTQFCTKDSKQISFCDELYEKISKLHENAQQKMDSKACESEGYVFERGKCYDIAPKSVVYGDAVKAIVVPVYDEVLDTCYKLNEQLQAVAYDCVKKGKQTGTKLKYSFRDSCSWNKDEGYYCINKREVALVGR